MNRIAITGGLAEGKSTVLGYLRDEGVSVLSADEVARTVFYSEPVQQGLAVALGVPAPLSRGVLAARIAADPAIRRTVNKLMHAEVWREIQASRAQAVEIPLLVEACLAPEFDRVWVVSCGRAEQLRRLSARVGSAALAKSMLAMQLPTAVKATFADRIVRTNREEARVRRYVLESYAEDCGSR